MCNSPLKLTRRFRPPGPVCGTRRAHRPPLTQSFGVLPLLVLFAVQSGCGEDARPALPAASAPSLAEPPRVRVETVRPMTVSHTVPIVGTLYPMEEVVVATKTAGVLRRTLVDVGDAVRPGDPLAEVDRVDYEMAAQQAEAALAETLARLGVSDVPGEDFDIRRVSTVERASARLENARFTYERLTAIGASVAEQEISDAAAGLRMAEADFQLALDEAQALLAAARQRRAMLDMARRKLSETLTVAPPTPAAQAGAPADHWVVAARLVTEGQYVNVAEPLYRMIVPDPLKLRSKVPERYAADVRIGQSVELQNLAGTPTSGRITRVNPAVETASRTFEIEALIENRGERLKAGAFAKGVIVLEEAAEVLTVPAECLLSAEGANHVIVVSEGTAQRRNVRIGRALERRVEVLSGLHAGEQVVMRPSQAIIDGQVVTVERGS